jgi:hypothetical protein
MNEKLYVKSEDYDRLVELDKIFGERELTKEENDELLEMLKRGADQIEKEVSRLTKEN